MDLLGRELLRGGSSPVNVQKNQAKLGNSRRSIPSLGGARLSPHAVAMMRRRVTFCPTPSNTSHAITPYATIYGKHPGLFDFDRQGDMQLNDAGVEEEVRKNRELYLLPSPD